MPLCKNEFIDKSEDSHPVVGSFPECVARAYLTGLASFGLAVASTHFTQKILKDKLPYPFKVQLVLTVSVAVGIAYKVGGDKVRICQANFMAEGEKRTYFTALKESENKL